jgi:hypothetical protein
MTDAQIAHVSSDVLIRPTGVERRAGAVWVDVLVRGPDVVGTTVKWWDGSDAQNASLMGSWSGTEVEPITVVWWDGAAGNPLQ